MFKVNKGSEPIEFTEYNRKNQIINWNSYDHGIKETLRKKLLEEQEESCCPYCEIKISLEKSQIEHIKPKDKFPQLLNDYENFIACCKNNQRCGAMKSNKWDDLFINPVIENPEEYFKYDIKTGRILPLFDSGNHFNRANITIEILHLNENRIVAMRKKYIHYYLYSPECREYLDYFPSLKRFLEKSIK